MKTVIIILFVNVFLYCSGVDPLDKLSCDEDGDGEFLCCKPFYERNSVCTVCPNGTAAKTNGADCTDCLYGFYGENCRAVCECKEKEICDNVYGCINYTKTTECPVGYTSEIGDQCHKCTKPFYGHRCAWRCNCTQDYECHHINGCMKKPTTVAISTAEYSTDNKDSEKTSADRGDTGNDKTLYYIALVSVLVMAVLIGMLLKSVKKKYCNIQPVSSEKPTPQQRLSLGSVVSYGYEFIDESNMIAHESTFRSAESFPDKQTIVQSDQGSKEITESDMATDNDDKTSSIKSDNSDQRMGDGYLNPYQPVQQDKIYPRVYKTITQTENTDGESEKNGSEIDGYLNPYQAVQQENMYPRVYKTIATIENTGEKAK